ncbi:hypothetical protein EYF80_051754 [Liparis tanakae]|uniref:Uncharacterized protein n=1 Tax=Liparis tanakae TaxID=230148 RepID=A0A4Z2FA98_9TELE|nr:hypothetical protein EYF80_051754 [Liparis tanakae]
MPTSGLRKWHSAVMAATLAASIRFPSWFNRHHAQGLGVDALGVPQASLQLPVQLHRQLRLSGGETKKRRNIRHTFAKRSGDEGSPARSWTAACPSSSRFSRDHSSGFKNVVKLLVRKSMWLEMS